MPSQARELSKREGKFKPWNEPKEKKAQKSLKGWGKTNCCNAPFIDDSDFCSRCGEHAGELK